MAEKKDGDIDQNKVKKDAENISQGNQPNPGEGNDPKGQPGQPQGPFQNPGPQQNQPTAGENKTKGAAQPSSDAGQNAGSGQTLTNGNINAKHEGGQLGNANIAPISEDEAVQKQHEELTRSYGADYVTAEKRKDDESPAEIQYFSKRAWDLLGPLGKDGKKDGWKPQVNTPPEVEQLKKQKAAKA